MRVFTSEVGWKQAIVHARNFKLEYRTATRACFPWFWEQRTPEGMSVEEVQEVYALSNQLSSEGCILDRMIKRQAFTRDKRDLLALLEEHLRLQGQTIDPDKVMDRIGIWPGLTPDQHADVYGYCCEFYLDMQTDVVKDLIFD